MYSRSYITSNTPVNIILLLLPYKESTQLIVRTYIENMHLTRLEGTQDH